MWGSQQNSQRRARCRGVPPGRSGGERRARATSSGVTGWVLKRAERGRRPGGGGGGGARAWTRLCWERRARSATERRGLSEEEPAAGQRSAGNPRHGHALQPAWDVL